MLAVKKDFGPKISKSGSGWSPIGAEFFSILLLFPTQNCSIRKNKTKISKILSGDPSDGNNPSDGDSSEIRKVCLGQMGNNGIGNFFSISFAFSENFEHRLVTHRKCQIGQMGHQQ